LLYLFRFKTVDAVFNQFLHVDDLAQLGYLPFQESYRPVCQLINHMVNGRSSQQ